MATENVQTFTDGNFDETVLKSNGPVLVDFWAEWCGPCRRLAPTVDALATEYAGKETVGQLMLTTMVENFPGHRDGIMGPELMAEMRAQAEKFGADLVQDQVSSVDVCTQPMIVKTSSAQYTTKTIIVATGASARLLG